VPKSGTGYGGEAVPCAVSAIVPAEKDDSLILAMDLLCVAVQKNPDLGVACEALLRKQWGVLGCLCELLGTGNGVSIFL
jgi:hypothetical protein